jgi:tetratricopeptide (TPR) repeat protein
MRQICFAILLVPALAWAAPKTASDWYNEGSTQFTLGNFDRAIESFKHAFELETDESKRAAYVYNIAQSYRQAGDCSRAYFFYKRFLALKATDTVKPLTDKDRKNVENFLKDLEPCQTQAAAIGKKPPESLQADGGESGERPRSAEPPKETRPAVATAGREPTDTPEEPSVSKAAGGGAPHVIEAWLGLGGTKVKAGDIDVPVQFAVALVAGYPIPITPELSVHVGGAFTFTPVPYTIDRPGTEPDENKTGTMTALMANAGVTYDVIPKLDLRFDAGVGALFFTASESKFTGGNPTNGALSMFHLRGAASADYAIARNVVLSATVAGSYSPPKEGLEDAIKSILSFDFMAGVGYRM